MSLPVQTAMPDNIVVSGNYTIKWRAIDPTTGADVSGVKISRASVLATDQLAGSGTADEPLGPAQLLLGPGA